MGTWGPRVENGDFPIVMWVFRGGYIYLSWKQSISKVLLDLLPVVVTTTWWIMTHFLWGIPINLYLFDWFDLFAIVTGWGVDPISTCFGFWFGKLFLVIHSWKKKQKNNENQGKGAIHSGLKEN